jgi:ribosome-binding protein aMBF1 (putative translation factor)
VDRAKKRKLEKTGWRVGSAADFLELTPEEKTIIELRLKLGNAIRKKRLQAKMTQEKFAARLKTSQSRLNKIEAGNPSVSFDLQIKSLIGMGVTIPELSKILGSRREEPAATRAAGSGAGNKIRR